MLSTREVYKRLELSTNLKNPKQTNLLYCIITNKIIILCYIVYCCIRYDTHWFKGHLLRMYHIQDSIWECIHSDTYLIDRLYVYKFIWDGI